MRLRRCVGCAARCRGVAHRRSPIRACLSPVRDRAGRSRGVHGQGARVAVRGRTRSADQARGSARGATHCTRSGTPLSRAQRGRDGRIAPGIGTTKWCRCVSCPLNPREPLGPTPCPPGASASRASGRYPASEPTHSVTSPPATTDVSPLRPSSQSWSSGRRPPLQAGAFACSGSSAGWHGSVHPPSAWRSVKRIRLLPLRVVPVPGGRWRTVSVRFMSEPLLRVRPPRTPPGSTGTRSPRRSPRRAPAPPAT